MKIAYFSPLPPKKTGISTYSYHLSKAINKLAEVHLYDADIYYSRLEDIPVKDFIRYPEVLCDLDKYDALLYHLGNNPHYHLDIYQVFLQKPGFVVLHDTVLYYLIAGLGKGGMLKEFCLNYGKDRLKEFWDLINQCPDADILRYQFPEKYPFIDRVLSNALGIIVHSHTSKQFILNGGYKGDISVVNLLDYPKNTEEINPEDKEVLINKHNWSKDTIIIGCFGFIGGTKRIKTLIDAFINLVKFHKLNVKLLIVGEGDTIPINIYIQNKNIQNNVIQTGFVSDQEFKLYLSLSDIVVNLRYPSMGEVSATLIQAFSYAKPCVVTNHAWFSELPDECVRKVGYGTEELDELVKVLLELIQKPEMRQRLGMNAQKYVQLNCEPDRVAQAYIDVLKSTGNNMTKINGELNSKWLKDYMITRLRKAIP
ncbi:hypothetical protein AMR41_28980 [Hapalosiphon sp. MRB220]|nr:hypothetical protein AMR41_28980 [Hapalosiphon sp. MRB220]